MGILAPCSFVSWHLGAVPGNFRADLHFDTWQPAKRPMSSSFDVAKDLGQAPGTAVAAMALDVAQHDALLRWVVDCACGAAARGPAWWDVTGTSLWYGTSVLDGRLEPALVSYSGTIGLPRKASSLPSALPVAPSGETGGEPRGGIRASDDAYFVLLNENPRNILLRNPRLADAFSIQPDGRPACLQYLWQQQGSDNRKCRNQPALVYDGTQAQCQQQAEASGHLFFSWRDGAASGTTACFTTSSCDNPIEGTNFEWHIFAYACVSP
eukprot:gene3090-3635_t